MPDEREITILGRWKIVLRRRQHPPQEFVDLSDAWRRFVATCRDAVVTNARRVRCWVRRR